MNRTSHPGRACITHTEATLARATTAPGVLFGSLLRQPWLLFALVLLVALMSAYVHLVNSQVERGERFREGLAQAAQQRGTPTAHWVSEVTLPRLSPVAMDTGR